MAGRLTRAFVTREQINVIANQVLGDLLPNQDDQEIHQVSTVQRYALGARKVVDERAFHYCRIGTALANIPNSYRLLVCKSQVLAANDRVPDAIHAVGATVISLPDTTAALNEYSGGWMEIWNAGGIAGSFQFRKIISNTATDGVHATFTIERGLDLALAAAGCQCTLHHSFYYNVGPAGVVAGYETPVGLNNYISGAVALGSFIWIQTWGPAFVAATGTWPGGAVNFRDVYFHSDGCINSANGETVGTTSPPRVGYAVENGNYGNCVVMLQLAP